MKQQKNVKKGMTIAVLAIVLGTGVWCWNSHQEKKMLQQKKQEMMEAFQAAGFDMTGKDYGTQLQDGSYIVLSQVQAQTFIPDMTGMTGNGEGAFTIPKVYIDSAYWPKERNVHVSIPACDKFPGGLLGQITEIMEDDSVIMYKFIQVNAVETLQDMTEKLDSMMKDLNDKFKDMQETEKRQ